MTRSKKPPSLSASAGFQFSLLLRIIRRRTRLHVCSRPDSGHQRETATPMRTFAR